MIVFLIPNLSKPAAVQTTCCVIQTLRACKAEVVLQNSVKHAFANLSVAFLDDAQALACCDVIVTVGGDGTILHAARQSIGWDKPLLGINLGRVGFLATMEADEPQKLERLVKGQYTLDKRRVLNVYVGGETGFCQTALNEVVVAKTLISQTIDVKIYCDDILVNEYLGDGVIIATPTGSTAYSLSAGGPVLDARIAGFVVTPICAHSMHSPPMVFSAERRLRVAVSAPNPCTAHISCDGRADESISYGDTIEVAYSDTFISLVSFNEASQFEAIDKKLKGR